LDSRFSGSSISTALSGSQKQAPSSAGGTVTTRYLSLWEASIEKTAIQLCAA